MKYFHTSRCLLLCVTLLLPFVLSCKNDPAQDVSASAGENYIIISVNGKEFTRYLFGEQHKYPFFYPVNGPVSGESITTWDQTPYPHHSSLFISLDWISSESVARANYWQPRENLQTGQVFSRNARIVEQTGKKVVLEDTTEWIVPRTGTQHFTENRKVTVWAPDEKTRVMDFEFTFNVLKDLEISRPTGHSFFSARVNPEIAVGDVERAAEWAHLGTGQVVDSEGDINEEGVREKSTPWAAYFGKHHGVTEGLAILQHPSNTFYPAQWVIRDYGFISPSPFAFIDAPLKMNAGDIHTYKYRVIIFAGTAQDANLSDWFDDFAKL
jgi:hypothetical protein